MWWGDYESGPAVAVADLTSDNVNVAVEAALKLYNQPAKILQGRTPEIAQALSQQRHAKARRWLLGAATRSGSPELAPAVLANLPSRSGATADDYEIAEEVFKALAAIGTPATVAALNPYLTCDDERLRSVACSSVCVLRNAAAMDALIDALHPDQPRTVGAVENALEQATGYALFSVAEKQRVDPESISYRQRQWRRWWQQNRFNHGAEVPVAERSGVLLAPFTFDEADRQAAEIAAPVHQMVQVGAAQSGFQIVEREKIEAVLAEQKLTLAGLTDPITAAKVGAIVGVRHAAFGRLATDEDRVTIAMRVVDVASSQVLASDVWEFPLLGAEQGIERLVKQLAEELGRAPVEGSPRQPRTSTALAGAEAVYVRGLSAMVSGRHPEAVGLLTEALRCSNLSVDPALIRTAYRGLADDLHAQIATHE